MVKINIAIDGPSAAGKSTTAKRIAKALNYVHLDTGAMYRATALYAQRQGLAEHLEQIIPLLKDIQIGFTQTPSGQHVTLNGEDVEAYIRTLEIGNLASQISTIKEVRAFLVAQQQAMGEKKGIVMDGRDIGTVVLPNADVKVYLTASVEVRAQRRYKELVEKGQNPDLEQIKKDIEERDYRDMNREIAPLRQAEDAVLVDSSYMTIEESVQAIMNLIK